VSNSFLKDPDSTLDYTFDWVNWLDGDTISTSAMSVSAGITLDSEANNTTTATAWISGGSVGRSYEVTNRITTALGRIVDRTIVLKVIER